MTNIIYDGHICYSVIFDVILYVSVEIAEVYNMNLFKLTEHKPRHGITEAILNNHKLPTVFRTGGNLHSMLVTTHICTISAYTSIGIMLEKIRFMNRRLTEYPVSSSHAVGNEISLVIHAFGHIEYKILGRVLHSPVF